MRHDTGVQQRLPRSSHPRDHRRLAAEAARRGDNSLLADLPACSSSTTANAQWWPLSPARTSTGPVARYDLRQNSFLSAGSLAHRGLSRGVRAYRPTGWQSPHTPRIPAIRPGISRELTSRSVAWASGFPKFPVGTACIHPGERSVGRGPGPGWQCRGCGGLTAPWVVAWSGSRRWYETRATRTGGHVWIGHQEELCPRWSYS
jgi:hypothetical protein